MNDLSRDVALLVLRLVFGGLMIVNHGIGKLQRLLGDDPVQFADPIGLGQELSLTLAAAAELGCGALVTLGLFTRVATLPLMFTMAVAAFIVHAADPLAKKELALLYLAAYAAIFLLGSGRFALQRSFMTREPRNRTLAFLLG